MIKTTSAFLSLALAGTMLCAAAPVAFAQNVVGLGVQGRPHAGGTPQRMFAFRHGLSHYRHHGHIHRTYRGSGVY